jgi:hypothetical protein
MKKHIAGFILFCFVVGTAAFTSEVWRVFWDYGTIAPKREENSYSKIKPIISETEATVGAIDKKSPTVRQAVFNLNTKQVNIELLFRDDVPAGEKINVKLSYFRNDSKGARFIKSESVGLLPESFYNRNKDTTAVVLSSYEWLDKLDSYENLYVIAEFDGKYSDELSSESYIKQTTPKFDVSKTIPKFDTNFAKEILLFSGKTGDGKFLLNIDR